MEVTFEPYKKLSFNSHMIFENAQELANVIAFAYPNGVPFQVRLFWANGIVFRFFCHPPTEALAKEILEGHLVWDHIELASMPEYKNELKVPERPLGNITTLDVSRHAIFAPLTAWVRDNLIEQQTS